MEEGQAVNEWLLVLNGEIEPDRKEELLSQAAGTLDERVGSVPGIEARVGEIIARRLAGGIGVDTWNQLQDRLTAFLGVDVAWLLWTYLLSEDIRRDTGRLASPGSVALLDTVSVIYGPDLEKVFAYSNENPDDWATIQRDYYWEMAGPRISVLIEKYNGERIRIAGPPDSALNLASAMMDLSTNVPVDSFSPNTLRQFMEKVGAMIQHLEDAEEEAGRDEEAGEAWGAQPDDLEEEGWDDEGEEWDGEVDWGDAEEDDEPEEEGEAELA